LIADWRLPDGNGIDLADRATKLRAKTIFVSGYIFNLPAAANRHGLLTKPISIFNLLAAVQHTGSVTPVPEL
jgi:CheY-like chemotaxis protein